MKRVVFTIAIIASILCCACTKEETIKEIEKLDPITQTAKMQKTAKSVADEAVMMKKYAEDMQMKELNQLQQDAQNTENEISEFGEE